MRKGPLCCQGPCQIKRIYDGIPNRCMEASKRAFVVANVFGGGILKQPLWTKAFVVANVFCGGILKQPLWAKAL